MPQTMNIKWYLGNTTIGLRICGGLLVDGR